MAARRLSRLQRRILSRLFAEYQRTQGGVIMGHYELVQPLAMTKALSVTACARWRRGG